MYPTLTPLPPFLALPAILRAVMAAVGGWGARGWLGAALTMLLYRRVSRACQRMERLIERYRAGRLVVRRCGVRTGSASPRVSVERIWPGRFGWLVRAASWHAAGYGSQLRAVLAEPEMVALLEAAPQAVGILRPICRALGVETSVLRPSVVVVPGVVSAPEGRLMGGASLTHPPKPRVEPFRVPLPRGVISAARRAGFGKLT